MPGHALVGDPVYGRIGASCRRRRCPEPAVAALTGFPRQALHAASLGFDHPVSGEKMRFEAELPQDMAELIALLRTGGPETHSTSA